MGGDVCFQTPHLSQEQETVPMVWVCNVLPSLNANTKNTQLECRTWQRGQVGGQALLPLSGPILTQEGRQTVTWSWLLGSAPL